MDLKSLEKVHLLRDFPPEKCMQSHFVKMFIRILAEFEQFFPLKSMHSSNDQFVRFKNRLVRIRQLLLSLKRMRATSTKRKSESQ